jgi:acyl dehydratase
MRIIEDLRELEQEPNQLLGISPSVHIDQEKIDLFATATGEDQWIHNDPIASASSPFRGTIAQGHLALATIVKLETLTYEIRGVKMRINYGLDRLRFITPLKVNSDIFAEIYSTKIERSGDRAKLFKDVTLFAKTADTPILKVSKITYLVLE